MACCLFGAKQLSEPMLEFWQLDLKNKLPWNFKPNSNIFVQENTFEYVVCENVAILSRSQCVNWTDVDLLPIQSTATITKENASKHRILCQ